VIPATAGQVSARGLAATSIYFRGQGGNVVCGYFSGPGIAAVIECGVLNPLNPPPPRPSVRDCHGLDFASDRVRLPSTGAVMGFCSGDVGVLAQIGSAPILAYGKSWHQGVFKCSASVAWITCKNASGHGFSLSRQHWHPI
jgi:hypothetical protein